MKSAARTQNTCLDPSSWSIVTGGFGTPLCIQTHWSVPPATVPLKASTVKGRHSPSARLRLLTHVATYTRAVQNADFICSPEWSVPPGACQGSSKFGPRHIPADSTVTSHRQPVHTSRPAPWSAPLHLLRWKRSWPAPCSMLQERPKLPAFLVPWFVWGVMLADRDWQGVPGGQTLQLFSVPLFSP